MEIKESDVEILDKFLDNLCLNKNVDVDFLYSSGIVQYDLRNRSKSEKEAKDILDKYNLYISAYCGEVKRIGFGSYYYIKDDRTVDFHVGGGFKGLYKRQLEEKRKNSKKDSMQKKVAIWQIIATIIGILSFFIAAYTFILKV